MLPSITNQLTSPARFAKQKNKKNKKNKSKDPENDKKKQNIINKLYDLISMVVECTRESNNYYDF